MNPRRVVLGAAWVPLLSGCMMGGMAHTGGMSETVRGERGRESWPWQHAEARSGDLTISLSFPTPSSSDAVAMEARLGTVTDPDAPIDGEIWLRIQTPGGSVDELRMERLHSSTRGTYQAVYSFRTPGSYLVTAEARTKTGAEVRTASLTTGVRVSGEPAGPRRDWLMPVAALGGIGMLVMMAVMIGG